MRSLKSKYCCLSPTIVSYIDCSGGRELFISLPSISCNNLLLVKTDRDTIQIKDAFEQKLTTRKSHLQSKYLNKFGSTKVIADMLFEVSKPRKTIKHVCLWPKCKI